MGRECMPLDGGSQMIARDRLLGRGVRMERTGRPVSRHSRVSSARRRVCRRCARRRLDGQRINYIEMHRVRRQGRYRNRTCVSLRAGVMRWSCLAAVADHAFHRLIDYLLPNTESIVQLLTNRRLLQHTKSTRSFQPPSQLVRRERPPAAGALLRRTRIRRRARRSSCGRRGIHRRASNRLEKSSEKSSRSLRQEMILHR